MISNRGAKTPPDTCHAKRAGEKYNSMNMNEEVGGRNGREAGGLKEKKTRPKHAEGFALGWNAFRMVNEGLNRWPINGRSGVTVQH